MRFKEEILHEIDKNKNKTRDSNTAASLHQRLTIEVLIDIRDQIPVLSTLISRLIVQTTQEP